MISSGVFMSRSMGLHRTVESTANRILSTPLSTMACHVQRWTSRSSFAPNAWAIGIEKPEHRPRHRPITRKFTEPVAPTAARRSAPRKRPTIAVSTKL